jgi:uncharacterized protein (TIGR00255 family)
MKSMTGFGAAEGSILGQRYKAEFSSVNSKKGVDLVISLPREWSAWERTLRSVIEQEVSRGRINVSVQALSEQKKNAAAERLTVLDRAKLKTYHREMKALAQELGVKEQVSLEFLLRLPGVMQENTSTVPVEKAEPELLKLIHKALQDFQKSREREGRHLSQDLGKRFLAIEDYQEKVAALQPAVLKKYRENLHKKIREAGVTVVADDERLLKELVLFSDRSDVSEEQTRLKAHLAEARRLLKSSESIGRKMDFLIQEIGREINTTGSKANDLAISKLVVEMKTELEKIREQVQNLE